MSDVVVASVELTVEAVLLGGVGAGPASEPGGLGEGGKYVGAVESHGVGGVIVGAEFEVVEARLDSARG